MNLYLKNKKGLTLIELLGVFAILGIVLSLVSGVLISGVNNIQKGQRIVNVQNEANYLLTSISTAFYSADQFSLTFQDDNADGKKDIFLNSEKITSDRYDYVLEPEAATEQTKTIDIKLTVINRNNADEKITLRTTLQKFEIDYKN